jgi:hypothetical protein
MQERGLFIRHDADDAGVVKDILILLQTWLVSWLQRRRGYVSKVDWRWEWAGSSQL